MFCFKCGKEIPAGAAFCPNCGAKAPAGLASPSAGGPAAPADQAAQTDQPAPPAETPAQPAPPVGAVVPGAASASAQSGAGTAGDPLAALVGKNAAYYLAQFQKIGAGQKARFNWAAFLLGPFMCFYRRSFTLFKKYFLPCYILFIALAMIGLATVGSFNLTLMLLTSVLSLGASVFLLVNTIRFGKNFNRDYYRHCRQELAKPAPARKGGTSIKNMLLFLLAVAAVSIVYGALSGAATAALLDSALSDTWEDDTTSYSDNVDSSYYEDIVSSYIEEPASSEQSESQPAAVLKPGSLDLLTESWGTFLAESDEQAVTSTPIIDDCDDDGLFEAFAVTAEGYDEEMGDYYGAKIYFIDSYGTVTLVCDAAPEGGPLYGYPDSLDLLESPDYIHDFFVWNLSAGTSPLSLVWGVRDGQVYESNISGQYCSVQWADGEGLAGYQLDFSQGYRDYVIYRLLYDDSTGSFIAIPDAAAYPEGESPLL